jgi:HEPN domain-containing protein
MKQFDSKEWLERAEHDLSTAKLLLKESNYFEIIVYHSHQCIEKLLKWNLIQHNEKFPFIHDLTELLKLNDKFKDFSTIRDKIIDLHNLLPKTRYPFGEQISKTEAAFSVSIADDIFNFLAN